MSRSRRYPAIPTPSADPVALLQTVQALKEAVELLARTRARGNAAVAAVAWQDLVDLGLIPVSRVPRDDRAG